MRFWYVVWLGFRNAAREQTSNFSLFHLPGAFEAEVANWDKEDLKAIHRFRTRGKGLIALVATVVYLNAESNGRRNGDRFDLSRFEMQPIEALARLADSRDFELFSSPKILALAFNTITKVYEENETVLQAQARSLQSEVYGYIDSLPPNPYISLRSIFLQANADIKFASKNGVKTEDYLSEFTEKNQSLSAEVRMFMKEKLAVIYDTAIELHRIKDQMSALKSEWPSLREISVVVDEILQASTTGAKVDVNH